MRTRFGFALTLAALLAAAVPAAASVFPSQPFTVNGNPSVSLSAGTATGSVSFGSGASSVQVWNGGSVIAWVAHGASGVTASVNNGTPVLPGEIITVPLATGDTYLAGITSSGSATLTITPGFGWSDPAFQSVNVGAAVGIANASTTSGSTGSLTMCAVTTAAPSGLTSGDTYFSSCTTGGALRIDLASLGGVALSGSVPVQGTFWQATQPVSLASLPALAAGSATIGAVTQASGPWTINQTQLAGTALGAPSNYGTSPGAVAVQGVNAYVTNTVPVSGTFWQTTQPVSAASLPLPSGASTATNQTAVQSAPGTAQTTAVTIQGNTSGIAVPMSAASLPLPTGAATAANQTAAQGATGSAVPADARYSGAVSSGNLTGIIQADNSAAINVSTATTTQLVALSSGKKIYVTAFNVVAGGTGNITFEYGTGTNCGTGTTALTGAYNLTAQSGLAQGVGLGPVLVVPAGNALCVLTSAAVQMSGSIAYTQF